jgi:hypothetical protein
MINFLCLVVLFIWLCFICLLFYVFFHLSDFTHTGYSLEGSYFYSDSMNDLPLLEQVTHPVAVDPDPNLRAEAEKRGWPVITLRS